MADYSPSTQGFLEASSLQAITLFFLKEHEVDLLEQEKPGARQAWQDIVSRERPAAPAAPCFFKPENYRRRASSSSDSQPLPPVRARAGPLIPREWKGLPAGACSRPDQARSDTAKRAAAAQRALELVRRWPHGDHAKAREELSAEDLAAWERRFLDTFTAGASVAVRIAFFLNLEKWGLAGKVGIWHLTWGDVERYMWTPSRKQRVAPSIARSRFHNLSWLRKYWGFPIDLTGRTPPAVAPAGVIFEENQAIPVDPSWMLAIENAWNQAEHDSALQTALSMTWLLWTSAIRLQQMQRSALTALTTEAVWGVCSLGKKSAGFRWAIPRRSLAGYDIGGCIFRAWKRHSDKQKAPLPSVIFELRSGAPLEYSQTRRVITAALSHVGLAQNLERATTYSLRRGCATMVAMWADQSEQEANGFWLSKRSSSMPDRYHGQRVQRSLVVKLANRELLVSACQLGSPLSWHNWGVALSKVDVSVARERANALQAGDQLDTPIPQEWSSVSPLPAVFTGEPIFPCGPQVEADASSVDTSTSRVGSSSEDSSSDSGATTCPKLLSAGSDAVSSADHDSAVLAVKLADVSWQATKYHGQLHIHFLCSGANYPACKRKRGLSDRQALHRVNAEGEDVSSIKNFAPVSLCRSCLRALRISESSVRSFLSLMEQWRAHALCDSPAAKRVCSPTYA